MHYTSLLLARTRVPHADHEHFEGRFGARAERQPVGAPLRLAPLAAEEGATGPVRVQSEPHAELARGDTQVLRLD